jgi:hypothetical protein
MPDLILSPTAYDDVFRTLLNDCRKLIIPLINEVFGEGYTGEEKVQFSPNEHFLNQQGGGEEKRITDSSFAVIGETTKKYHLECQSTEDSSILIRIFEYDAQIALDQDSEETKERIIVSFPNTAVLYLRSSNATPDEMQVVIRTPGGEVSYQIPVMKVMTYTIEEIFEKGLLFLIPFYIFTYEQKFKEIEKSTEKLSKLMAEYETISVRLEESLSSGFIDEFTKKTIMDMSERVLENIAKSYENIRKGVETVMGGKILDYEAKRIRNDGINEGFNKGRSEGIIIGAVEMLRDIGLDDKAIIAKISEKYNLTLKEAEGYVLTSAVM